MASVSGVTDTSSSNDSCQINNEDGVQNESCNGESKSNEESKDESKAAKPSLVCTPASSRRFILRKSQFESPGLDGASPRSKFVLNPPKLSNPFLKVENEDEEPKPSDPKTPPKASSESEEKGAAAGGEGAATPGGGTTPSGKPGLAFLPLQGGEASTPVQPSSLSAASTPSLGFVFGQNIHEKVEAATPAECTSEAAEPSPSKETEEVTTNGTSEMLFSTRVKRESAEKSNDAANKSLSEAAREYEEARAVKRKFEEVPIHTGEEEEANVLQINCKLFSFSNCTWLERGRGTLRVNDLPATTPASSRLIVRAAGSLRVVLNTKIWSEMKVDRVSSKSLRITGMDSSGVVKVFVIMAGPKEVDQLQKCLEWRVNNLKKNEESPPKKSRPEDS